MTTRNVVIVVDPENSVISFLNNILYNLSPDVMSAILADETIYLDGENDDFKSKSEANDGSRATFIPFYEVTERVNSDDSIEKKSDVLKEVALKRLKLAVGIAQNELVARVIAPTLMANVRNSSEYQYLVSQDPTPSVKELYNNAYAAEIASHHTEFEVHKAILPLLYWDAEMQKFSLIIEPTLGGNRIRKALKKKIKEFKSDSTPKVDDMLSSLLYHTNYEKNTIFTENVEVVKSMPDTVQVNVFEKGESQTLMKPHEPKYTMSELESMLNIGGGESKSIIADLNTSHYITFLLRKIDNALDEYYRKIVILYKIPDEKLDKVDADILLEKQLDIAPSNWSNFDQKVQERGLFDPRRWIGEGGGVITVPLLVGGLCTLSPFVLSGMKRSRQVKATAHLFVESSDAYSTFINEILGEIVGGKNTPLGLPTPKSFASRFKEITSRDPQFKNLGRLLTSEDFFEETGTHSDEEDIVIANAAAEMADSIAGLEALPHGMGSEALTGPNYIGIDYKNKQKQAILDMGNKILNGVDPTAAKNAVALDTALFPPPVKETFDGNKFSIS